jgi:UDP-glucose 4-epimerase
VLSAVHGLTGVEPVPVRHLPMRPGEEPNSVVLGDPTTLSLLGNIALRPLYYGVQDTVAYFREYLKAR